MADRKYDFVDGDTLPIGMTGDHPPQVRFVHRIIAARDFGDEKKGTFIAKGTLGGYVEKDGKNLSHKGDAWVGYGSIAAANSEVTGNARVIGHSLVTDYAIVGDDAVVSDTIVRDKAIVKKWATVCKSEEHPCPVIIKDHAMLTDHAFVMGDVQYAKKNDGKFFGMPITLEIGGTTHVTDYAKLIGTVRTYGFCEIKDHATVKDASTIADALIHEHAYVAHHAKVLGENFQERAEIGNDAHVTGRVEGIAAVGVSYMVDDGVRVRVYNPDLNGIRINDNDHSVLFGSGQKNADHAAAPDEVDPREGRLITTGRTMPPPRELTAR